MCYNYEEINSGIEQYVNQDVPRKRMLCYALDSNLLNQDAYNPFPGYINNQNDGFNKLKSLPWFVGLYWVRQVYYNCNGNDYCQTFRRHFNQELQKQLSQPKLYDILKIIDNVWHFSLNKNYRYRSRFLAECLLIEGRNQGESSEIWKTIVPIVHKIKNQDSDYVIYDKIVEYADSHQLPSYYNWLIENYDPSFLELIKALFFQNGEGWQEIIAETWSLHGTQNSATAQWMLYLNGSIIRIDLVIDSIHVETEEKSLTIEQNGTTLLEKRLGENEEQLHVPLSNLRDRGMNIEEAIIVKISGRKIGKLSSINNIFNFSEPILFRWSKGSAWFPIIDTDENPHIYARRLIIFTCKNENDSIFSFGNNTVDTSSIGWYNHKYKVFLLNFDDIYAQEPQQLKLNDKPLIYIGTKPYINIINKTSDIQYLEYNSANVLFGDNAEIIVRNVAGDNQNNKWKCENAEICINENSPLEVTIKPTQFGTPIRVFYGKCSITLMFFPQEICQILNATNSIENANWQWKPTTDEDERIQYARSGKLKGKLLFENNTLNLIIPLQKLTWWWEKGISNNGEKLNKQLDCNDYSEFSSYYLSFWAPENKEQGNNLISLKYKNNNIKQFDCPALVEHESVSQLLRNSLNFENTFDRIDSLYLGAHEIANILHVPDRPILHLRNNEAYVFFPQDNYDPSDYSLVYFFESGLIERKIITQSCHEYINSDNQINLSYNPKNDEGVWIVLVKVNQQFDNFIDFALQTPDCKSVLEVQSPDTTQSIRNKLENWHGENLSDEKINKLRCCLDFLYYKLDLLINQGVFKNAVDNRELLEYSNKKKYWDKYFDEHCSLDELAETLGLMLKVGFNWCAEPNWLLLSLEKIKKQQRMTRNRRRQLKNICPLIPFQQLIENSYPGRDLHIESVNQFLSNLERHYNCFHICCPDSYTPTFQNGVCLKNITHNGFILTGYGQQPRNVTFNYHGTNTIDTPTLLNCRFKIKINDDNVFYHFIETLKNQLEQSIGYSENLPEPIVGAKKRNDLYNIFNNCIINSINIIGKIEDKGLACIFSSIANEWNMLADDNPAESNFVLIFEAAVLCRLHSWYGWNGNNYPANWPLNEDINYDLICFIIKEAWHNEKCKRILIYYLTLTEWLLSWFSSEINN